MKKKKKNERSSSKDKKNPARSFSLGKVVKVPFERLESLPVFAMCKEANNPCAMNSYTGSNDTGA